MVKTGREDKGKRLVPAKPTIKERMEELIRAGLISWNGQRLTPRLPSSKTKGKKTVAELLLEDR